jgi:hypothetical protein
MSASRKGKPLSPEHSAAIADALRDRRQDPEGNRKRSEAMRAYWATNPGPCHTAATKEKMSAAGRGKTKSDETKAKMAEAARRRWARLRTERTDSVSN